MSAPMPLVRTETTRFNEREYLLKAGYSEATIALVESFKSWRPAPKPETKPEPKAKPEEDSDSEPEPGHFCRTCHREEPRCRCY
jgi:hypothetical protein